MKQRYQINVNGFMNVIEVETEDIQQLFLPLIQKITSLAKHQQQRMYVFLAGSAGSGKSSVSLFLEMLAKQYGFDQLQVLGMDGFHYSNAYLSTHKAIYQNQEVLLKEIKGNPLTFDVEKMVQLLEKGRTQMIAWPLYDRNLHDPIEQAILVNQKVVLIEGNYLLLKDERYQKLRQFCDYSILLQVDDDLLKERLIARKTRGGLSYALAQEWYQKVDSVNVAIVKNNSIQPDCTIYYDGKHYKTDDLD